MLVWQIGLISYLAAGVIVAIALFFLRRNNSPERTELLPSLVAAFVAGILWGAALIMITIKPLISPKTGEEKQ